MHITGKVLIALMLCAFMLAASAQAEIVDICYHKAYPSTQFDDSGMSTDQGGYALVFFRSEVSGESISSITLNGTDLETLLVKPSADNPTIDWYKQWPLGYTSAGQYGAVWVKAWNSPLKEGDTATFAINTNHATYSMTKVLDEPALKLAFTAPSRDRKSIFLYLRNDGSVPYAVSEVHINEDVTDQTYFIGSAQNIPAYSPWISPNHLGIIEVKYPAAQALMELKCIRVMSVDAQSNTFTAGAAERLLATDFYSGIWQSSFGDDTKDKTYALENFRVNGSLQVNNMSNLYTKYGIHTITTNTTYSNIVTYRNSPFVGIWDLAEEPGDRSDIPGIIADGYNAWLYGPAKPTYVNLHQNQKFGWYAPLADIAGMDHYVFYAPNAFTSLSHDIDEAYEYAKSIKLTAEPKPVWNWTQVTKYDFPLFGVNLQAWANIMYGAKGVMWWNYQSDGENHASQGDQVAEAALVMRQLNQIRDLIAYSDFAPMISSTNPDVRTSALVSHDAMVAMVAADDTNMSFNWSYFASFPSSINRETGTLSFTVPDWISIETVKEIKDTGLVNVSSYTVNGQNVSIDYDVQNRVAAYLIGAVDTEAPAAPANMRIAETNASGTIFVWDDAYDNYGVKEYRVYKNGSLVKIANGPVYIDTAYQASNTYKIAAVDAFGNVSGFAHYDKIAPTGTILVEHGNAVTFYPTVDLTLSATDTGSGVTEMRFYTNTWGSWMPYATTAQAVIPTGSYGTKNVYVQYRDAAGTASNLFLDTIIYTLKGDFDGSQTVAGNDLAVLGGWWLSTCGQDHCGAVDINLDGVVDFRDFSALAQNW